MRLVKAFWPALVTVSVPAPLPATVASLVPPQTPEVRLNWYVVPVLTIVTWALVPRSRLRVEPRSRNVAADGVTEMAVLVAAVSVPLLAKSV